MTATTLFARLRHPRTTVRWRLTILYGALFLVSGAVLLAITYALVDHAQHNEFVRPAQSFVRAGRIPSAQIRLQGHPNVALPSQARRAGYGQPPSPALLNRLGKLLRSNTGKVAVAIVGRTQQISDLHQLEVESLIALAIMAVLSGALGWVVAGRVLAPLRTMTAATREISEANLNERLSMTGPRDELRALADTIDGLLGRLEGAFDAQKRFVANASHELRTPLTAVRALLELVLTDPDATIATYRTACEQVLDESEQQERLIDALLALAGSQRGLDAREPVDLDAVTMRIVDARRPEAAARGLTMTFEPAEPPTEPTVDAEPIDRTVAGDARLIERLASNLIDNAIRHNVGGGSVTVRVTHAPGVARLTVVNTGPVIGPDEVARLAQPFHRLAADRTGHGDGLGLVLSIVSAIVDAHGATLTLHPLPQGGLHASVSFPAQLAGTGDVAAERAALVEAVHD